MSKAFIAVNLNSLSDLQATIRDLQSVEAAIQSIIERDKANNKTAPVAAPEPPAPTSLIQ